MKGRGKNRKPRKGTQRALEQMEREIESCWDPYEVGDPYAEATGEPIDNNEQNEES